MDIDWKEGCRGWSEVEKISLDDALETPGSCNVDRVGGDQKCFGYFESEEEGCRGNCSFQVSIC